MCHSSVGCRCGLEVISLKLSDPSSPKSDRPVLSMRLDVDQIFAPTAALLYQFREVVIGGRTTRVADYDQPLFAWR